MIKRFFILLVLLRSTLTFAGGIEFTAFARKPNISVNTSAPLINVKDPQALESVDTDHYSTRVSLSYSKEDRSDIFNGLTSNWSYKVYYQIRFSDKTGKVFTTYEDSVAISYDPTGHSSSILQDVKNYNSPEANYCQARLFILSSPQVSGSVPSDVTLEVTLTKSNIIALSSSAPKIQYDALNHRVSWSYQRGAEFYQLEYVYIDDYDVHPPFGSDRSAPFLYKEPVRVEVRDQYYDFLNTYPKGKIYFRVRGVGLYPSGTGQLPGSWGYTNSANVAAVCVNSQEFSSDNKKLNWQVQSSFAEGGKTKKQIVYWDGSLRKRQEITNMASDSSVIVHEIKYDYEGRPVLDVLPFPMKLSDMTLKTNVNTFSGDYKKSYDTKSSALPMDTSSGAARYYSSINSTNGIYKNYLPSANGYVYSLTRYTYDQTGKVQTSSGVGKSFRFDPGLDFYSQHYVRHYYSTPQETELRRMFGSNVGNNKHYKKVATVDPNGQLSVSYYDQENRVIATALAGYSPSNMDSLAIGREESTITTSLNDNNVVDKQNYVSRSVNEILNLTPNTPYTFQFNLTGVLNKPGAAFNNVCKTCVYELYIKITDPKGALVKEYRDTINPSSVNCSGNTYTENIEVAKDLLFTEIGSYKVVKELKLLSGAVEALISNVKTDAGALFPDSASIVQQYIDAAALDSNMCNITCEDHCLTEAFKAHPDWTWSEHASEINAYVSSCVATNCTATSQITDDISRNQCESYKNQMLQQLKPGGYYNSLPGWLESKVSEVTFKQEGGLVNESPQPSVATLRNGELFKDQWALDLFGKHPEICQYNMCLADTASSNYDMKMSLIKDTIEAMSKGFYNPLNMTTGVNGPPTSSVTPVEDPFFKSGGRGASSKTSFTNLLNAYKSEVTDNLDYNNNGTISGTVTLWQFTNFKKLYNDQYPTPEQRWQMFYGLYKGEKYTLMKYLDGCTYLDEASEHTIFKSPAVLTDSNEVNSLNQINLYNSCGATCNENVRVWMNMIAGKCPSLGTLMTTSDSLDISDRLRNYCINSCGYANPFGLLIKEDIASNADLIYVKNKLFTSYGCVLDSIAQESPYTNVTSVTRATVSRNAVVLFLLMNKMFAKSRNAEGTANTFDPIFFNDYLISNFPFYKDYIDIFKVNREVYGPHTIHHGRVVKRFNKIYLWIGLEEQYEFPFNILIDFNTIREFKNLRYDYARNDGSVLLDVVTYNDSTFTVGSDGPIYQVADRTLPLAYSSQTIQVTQGLSTNFFSYTFNARAQKDSCIAAQREQSIIAGTEKWKDSVKAFVSEYARLHYNNCLSNPFKEEFFYQAKEPYQYVYTLYYYDQAGNLVQTVPPEGVNLLSGTSDFTNGVYTGTSNPDHKLRTVYKYNSLNQLIWQKTPDGGATNFYYNKKGQLVLSQNARQKAASSGSNQVYSYTKYDRLGRVIEVGEIRSFDYDSAGMANPANVAAIEYLIENPEFPGSSETLAEITRTYYDLPYPGAAITQENLRGRVSATVTFSNPSTPETKTYYSYDIHGNVKKLCQDVGIVKQMEYDYDLLSGNVNKVYYQKGQSDQFIHKYTYDKDNRLRAVKTSQDGILWEEDARYFYYAHGPLARVELGEDKVQGLDYTYTLNGWLKNVNIPHKQGFVLGTLAYVFNTKDLGSDGLTITTYNKNKYVAQDEFMMGLSYFKGDYQPVNVPAGGLGSVEDNVIWNGDPGVNAIGGTVNRGLYNGNISIMVTDIKDLEGRIIGATSQKSDRLMAYRYDQLNRISRAYSYGTYTEASGWAARSISTGQAFDASFAYDKNGNITSLKRYDESGNLMDNLSYNYNKTSGWLTNNRLRSVSDAVVGSASATDIESGQILDNYTYDQIGNLISDAQEGISSISWSVYGKVKKVTKVGNNSDIEFVYDAAGQRISKKIRTKNSGGSYTPANDVTTYYIRDASGNIMAVYEESSGVPTLKELPIYGSDRVGILEPGASLAVVNHFKRITSRKNYELKDHLGNVRVVISDFKSGRDRTGDSKADFYLAKVTSFSDYGPFGELLEGRTWMANGYRYGFNGKEKDDEWNSGGAIYDYGFRIYDPRIAKFLSVDPLASKYPNWSPYAAFGNNPIRYKDEDGREPIDPRTGLPMSIDLGSAVVVSFDYDPKIHVATKDEVLYNSATSSLNRFWNSYDDNLSFGVLDFDMPTPDRSASLISPKAAVAINNQKIDSRTSWGDQPSIQTLFNPVQHGNFAEAAKTGHYTYIDQGWAEGGALTGYKDKNSFNIISVEANQVSRIVNMQRNAETGMFDVNTITNFTVSAGEVQTRTVKNFWGRERQEQYRTLTITENTAQFNNNEKVSESSKTYTREEVIK